MRTDLYELLARRAPFLDRLSEGPTSPRTLVADLPQSRPTVNRALRELQEAGLVERTDEGYETTPAGDLVWESHRHHRATTAGVLDAAEVLAALPDGEALPPDVVANASVSPGGGRVESVVDGDLPVGGWLAAADPDLLGTVASLPPGTRVSLVVAPGALAALCETAPDALAALASRSATDLRVGETPPFSLVLSGAAVDGGGLTDRVEHTPDGGSARDRGDPTDAPAERTATDADTSAVVVVHDEGAGRSEVRGTLDLSSATWATERFRALRAAATPVDDPLAAGLDRSPPAARVRLAAAVPDAFDEDPPLPPTLARQGFDRLTSDALAADPEPPTAALRSGLTPVEVHHGYAIQRYDESTGEPLAGRLGDLLAEGTDCVLLGGPGTGKSTTCKQVAVRWRGAERGPVLYRSGDGGGAVEDPELLAAYLRAVDGHALAVVEDAPRPEVDAVFAAVAECADRDDVSFLLDARESEWRDRSPAPGTDAVTEVSMPALGGAAAERMVDHVESLTGAAVDADPDALLDALRSGAADHDGPEPGGMYLLNHWLSLREDEGPATATPDSALTAHVERVHEVAESGGPTTADLAVLVNLLGLAGVAVRRELVYGVAFARSDDPDPAAAAETALERLDGHCVFDVSEPGTPARFRTPHDTWSTTYLATLQDRHGTEAAREQFCGVLSSLLTLADDDDRCDRVADALGAVGPNLTRLREDPEGWASDMVAATFEVPTDRGQLAPLYGHTDERSVDLPAAGPADCRLQVALDRGTAYSQLGDEAAAGREFEWVLAHADASGADPETVAGARAHAERRLASQARDRGDLERAEELLARSRDRYDDLDDPVGRANVERNLGIVCAMRGDYDGAAAHFETALDGHRAAGNRTGLANAYNDRGLLAKKRGDMDVAEDCLSAARDLAADLGDTRREAVATMNLGTIALEHDDHEAAERLLVDALGLMREAGYERGVDSVLTNLGSVALARLDLDAAEDYLERALAKSRDLDDADGKVASQRHLADVARHRGRFDAADDHVDRAAAVLAEDRADVTRRRGRVAMARGDHETAEAVFADLDERFPGVVPRRRAELARRRGDLDAAETHVERSLDHYAATDEEPGAHARALATRARVAMDRGDLDEAADALERAAEYCTPDDPDHLVDVVVATACGRLRHRRGDHAAAVDALAPVVDACQEAGAALLGVRAADLLVDALLALDRQDAAGDRAATAVEMATETSLADRAAAIADRVDASE